MSEGLLGTGEVRICFVKERGGLLCHVHHDSGNRIEAIRCRLSGLIDVLGGTRYHFAAYESTCTVYRNDQSVVIELQTRLKMTTITVPLQEFELLIEVLSAELTQP